MNLNSRVCAVQNVTVYSKGLFLGDNPLNFVLPAFLLQVILFFLISQVIYYVLRPLKQTKFVCDVLSGIILEPSVLGRNKAISDRLSLPRGIVMMYTIATIGSIYFIFIVAVKMDKTRMLRMAKKAWPIGVSALMVTIPINICLCQLLHSYIPRIPGGPFLFFFSSFLLLSYFPSITHVLGELNILNSEVGKLALSSTILNEIVGWVIVALAAVLRAGGIATKTLMISVSICAFVSFFVFVLRPAIRWIIRRTP